MQPVPKPAPAAAPMVHRCRVCHTHTHHSFLHAALTSHTLPTHIQGSSFDVRLDNGQVPFRDTSLEHMLHEVATMDTPALRTALYKALHFASEAVCPPHTPPPTTLTKPHVPQHSRPKTHT